MVATRKHVLMVSIPAYGHIIPLLELAKKIAQHHQVTFAVSDFRAREILQRELLTNDAFPVVGIPDGYFEEEDEKAMSVPVFRRILNVAVPGAQKLFEAIPFHGSSSDVTTHALGITTPVDVVISDNLNAGALSVLHKRKIPFYLFNSAASGLTLQTLMTGIETPADTGEEPEVMPFTEMPEPGAPPQPMPPLYRDLFLQMREAAGLATGIIGNSVYEFEAPIIDIIRLHPDTKNVPFRCVGPLIPVEKISTKLTEQQEKVKKWLDGKEPQSVVYVSFGSIAVPKPEYATEIIKALQALGKPFIWSLPKREQSRLPAEFLSKKETQFEASDSEHLILDWAPQKLILQHPATAVFLSHCGWNSTIESIASGVPVVTWPMFADQKLNALELVHKGSGWFIEGTGMFSDKVISAAEIEEAFVQTAGFGGNNGKSKYREAAQMWKDKMRVATGSNGSSERDFSELIKFQDGKD